MDKEELWKPVKGFEDILLISNFGKIKRIKPARKELLKTSIDRGYEKINLSINGKRYLRYIHRMVAEAFIPNPNNYKEVNHIDNNPNNNNVDNLEWCDRKYNLQYMIKHQEEIKDRHERRIEALEMIYYLANENGSIDKNTINEIISDDLLGEY